MAINFKQFLLNESQAHLGHKIGDILNGIQDLLQNYEGMGQRHVTRSSEQIVNMIRRIIHTNWPQDQEKNLKALQKSGVGIMRAIEEKGDLKDILQSVSSDLQKVATKMGLPANSLGTPEGTQQADAEKQTTGAPQGKEEPENAPGEPEAPPEQQGGQMPPVPPQNPNMGQNPVVAPPSLA